MSRAIILALAISWLAAGSLALGQSDKLKGDERLAAEVHLSIAGEPLRVLCEKLSGATGAKIWADGQVASEKVAIFCKARPVREVMAHVADLFGYTWRIEDPKDGERTYKLFQDSQSTARDREVKMAYLKQAWDSCWDEITETADPWNKYQADNEAWAMAEEAELDIENEARTYDELTEREREVLSALSAPRRGMLASLIHSLPQLDIDRLLEGEALTFSTYDTDPRWRLDPALAEKMARKRGVSRDEHPDSEPQPEGRFIGAVLSLTFGPGGGDELRDVGLYGEFCARYEDGTIADSYAVRFESQLAYSYRALQPGKSADEQEALVDKFPWLGERITIEPPAEVGGLRRGGRFWVPELLRFLHDASGVSIVSDAYWSRGEGVLLLAQKSRLVDYLNELCYGYLTVDAYKWIPDGDWLHFRCGLYPIARLEEFPAGLAEKLTARDRIGDEIGLLDLVDVAWLNDWQRNAYWFGKVPRGLPRLRGWSINAFVDALRICSKISHSLITGDNFDLTLTYAQMTRDQQKIFLQHLTGPAMALWPDLAELARCAFEVSMKTQYVFENHFGDWPRDKFIEFKLFSWKGRDRKRAEAAYEQFIKENPEIPNTSLHHYVERYLTFTYRVGDEVIERSYLPLSRHEVEDEEQEPATRAASAPSSADSSRGMRMARTRGVR